MTAVCLAGMAGLPVMLGGCETNPSSSGAGVGFSAENPVNRPANPGQTWRSRAGIRPFGIVEFDSFSLPLPSPDGEFIATQTGIAPPWEAALARPNAEPPAATRVEVHRLAYDADPDADQNAVEFITTVSEATLLGRSADDHGFLIEAPQEDGSRWIGKADWHSGEIDWLVDDEHVNAFATFNHAGWLAWSRRKVDAEQFEMVVRKPSGEEWTVPANGGSWLMPVWSDADDWLFVLRLEGDVLRVLYANASNGVTFRQSQRSITLARGATLSTAYQVLNSTVTRPIQREVAHQLIFWHPAQACMAVWRPHNRRGSVKLLARGSFAAEVDRRNMALVSTDQGVVQQRVDDRRQQAELVAGMYVIRRIEHPEWEYLMFSLDHLHQVGIGAMKLLDPGQ